jgi:putative DNA primase/helicase
MTTETRKIPQTLVPTNPNASPNLSISTKQGIYTINTQAGTIVKLTAEEMRQIADGAVPAGLGEKLSQTELNQITEFAKSQHTNAGATRKKGERHGGKHESDIEMPGWATIADAIKAKYRVRTIPEMGTDRETLYYFNGQIYERADEILKAEIHALYIGAWKEILNTTTDLEVHASLKKLLRKGPSTNDIHEVLNNLRRTTLTNDKMNPDSHVPFLNGLLNLKTRRLEPFTPDLFYTYQINANLLDTYATLKDTPLFNSLLATAFYETDVPLVLTYAAYALRPDFPVHRTLFILGRERIGKGTFVRVIQGLMKKGSGAISLARLLTGERFQFSGVEGKNLLVDSETKRKFKRGTILEWGGFCNLFGSDTLSIEPKGKEAHDYVSKAKGIFLGNLPFIRVDSPPAVARILVVETRNERPKRVIPKLDEKILAGERDMIATLLVQIMFKHEERNFMFPGQLTDDATAGILEELADPVANFADEMTEFVEGENTNADDAYIAFSDWCAQKGIPVLKPQVFKKSFSHHYEKSRRGPRGKQEYIFANCRIYSSELEVEKNTPLQVGYGVDLLKTPKISLSGDRYRRIQHESLTFAYEEKDHDNDNDHDKRVRVRKLDTDKDCIGEPKITAPSENESVSNLDREISSEGCSSITDLNANPVKSDTASETDHNLPIIENSSKTQDPGHGAELTADPVKPSPAIETGVEQPPITEENGKRIISHLLGLGYHIDPDSGRNIDRKYYKIGVLGLRSLSADMRGKLENIMVQEHFKLFNSGGLGIWWFTRPLVDVTKEGTQ